MRMHIFILGILVILLYGCESKRKNCMIQELMNESVVGKTLPVIDSLYQDNMGMRYLVLLCSPYDCGPCLDKAFETLRIINQSNTFNKKWVVSVLDEPSSLQRRYNYYDYTIFDGDDMIRKALKYIPTPVFFVADSDNNIVLCHFPTKDDEVKEISNHIINNLILTNYETI